MPQIRRSGGAKDVGDCPNDERWTNQRGNGKMDGHYVQNDDEGSYKGPFEDLLDSMEAGKAWMEDGVSVVIHMVEDDEVIGSWDYTPEGLANNTEFEGDTFSDLVSDHEHVDQ